MFENWVSNLEVMAHSTNPSHICDLPENEEKKEETPTPAPAKARRKTTKVVEPEVTEEIEE